MRPKEWIDKKTKEAALKAFGATQLNNNQETSPYFVGKISADRKKITDPQGRQYNLTFTGNPNQCELAQRLSNDSAYVDARKNKQMNVDGSNFRNLFLTSISFDPLKAPNLYIWDAIKGRYFLIPYGLFPNSEIGGNVADLRVLGPGTADIDYILGIYGNFSSNGNNLLIAIVVTNQPGSQSISQNRPMNVVWIELQGIKLTSTINPDDNNIESYILSYVSIVKGQRTKEFSQLQYQPSIAPEPTPYAPMTLAPVDIVNEEDWDLRGSAHTLLYTPSKKIMTFPFVVGQGKSANLINFPTPPPSYSGPSTATTSSTIMGLLLLDLQELNDQYLPQYTYNSGPNTWETVLSSPTLIEYADTKSAKFVNNKIYTNTGGGDYTENDQYFYTVKVFSTLSFSVTETSGTYLFSRFYGRDPLDSFNPEEFLVDRFYVSPDSVNIMNYTSTEYDFIASFSNTALQYETAITDPLSIFGCRSGEFIINGAFDNTAIPEQKRLTANELRNLYFRPKLYGQNKILAIKKIEEESDDVWVGAFVILSLTSRDKVLNDDGDTYTVSEVTYGSNVVTKDRYFFRGRPFFDSFYDSNNTLRFILDFSV